MIGEIEGDAAVVFAERFDSAPDDFAGGDQRVEIAGRIICDARGRISRSTRDAGSGAPCRIFDRVEQRVEAAARLRTPCQWVSKRASMCCSTWFDSLRNRGQ